jgi:formyltetrahydrofolate deformylase
MRESVRLSEPTDRTAASDARGSQVLLVTCTDRPGLIHAITGILLRHGVNVVSNDEFVDRASQRFVMRSEFVGGEMLDAIPEEIGTLLPADAEVRLAGLRDPRIVVLATREHHCLAELLLRHAYEELGARVQAVVSNRPVLEGLTARFGVPFHHVPHEELTRDAHEAALQHALQPYTFDYLVLAKYMRVLSARFVRQYAGRIVNIHHSFLPAFVGANPYRQAFERGVKIIGATAHFVTDELDEGPIIAQDVIRVDHSDRVEEMAQAGRDVEKIVLAKALKLVFEHRVFVIGKRTIVFD